MYGNWAFDPFRSTGQSVGAMMSGTGFFEWGNRRAGLIGGRGRKRFAPISWSFVNPMRQNFPFCGARRREGLIRIGAMRI